MTKSICIDFVFKKFKTDLFKLNTLIKFKIKIYNNKLNFLYFQVKQVKSFPNR